MAAGMEHEAFPLAVEVARKIVEDDVAGMAGRVAYSFLFALFPFLLFLVSLLGFVPFGDLRARLAETASRVVPPAGFSVLADYLQKLAAEPRHGALSFGLVVALWSATGGITSVIATLNRAYHVPESRSFLTVQGLALAMVLIFSVSVVAALAALLVAPRVLRYLPNPPPALAPVVRLGRWPLVFLLAFLPMWGILSVGPAVRHEAAAAVPGAAVSAALWLAGSWGLTFYADRFGSFDRTYGSIGAGMALLTWLYLTGFSLLAGGELNSVLLGIHRS